MKKLVSTLLALLVLLSALPMSVFAVTADCEEPLCFGDANGDDTVNVRDAAIILQYLADWDVDIDDHLADVNNDGKLNVRDAATILQYLADWDVDGIGEAYVVTFDLGYDDAPEMQEQRVPVGKNATVTMPTEREDYAFVGWYTDDSYENTFSFAEELTASYDLVARWVDTADLTDTDSDGLTDPWEEYYETSKTDADTDSDGISDSVEIMSLLTDPLLADSDGNGTNDGSEDFDEDYLTNLEELSVGSDPLITDTDLDGLSDYDEVTEYGTEPDTADTDGDGLNDGDEIALDLNPLVQKTDGETLDSERTFEQTLDEQSIDSTLLEDDNAAKPSLDIIASGNINSSTTITQAGDTALTTNKSIVGAPVSVNTSDDLSDANAKLSFDISDGMNTLALGDEEPSQYIICRYEVSEDGTEFEPLDTTYSNGVLTAGITGAGTYFVLDTEAFLMNLGIDVLGVIEGADTLSLQSVGEAAVIPHATAEERKAAGNAEPENLDELRAEMEALNESLSELSAINIGGKAQADIVFVIDVTGSMWSPIYNVATNVNRFADDLVNKYKINANFSVIEFQDITCDGLDSTIQHKNGSSSWWNAKNVDSFKSEINSLYPDAGGDWAETPIDGLEMARRLVSQSTTQKFFVLITDAPYKENNQYGIKNMYEMIDLLVEDEINVSVITDYWLSDDELIPVGIYTGSYEYVANKLSKYEEIEFSREVLHDKDSDKYYINVWVCDEDTYESGELLLEVKKSDVAIGTYIGYAYISGEYKEIYYNAEKDQYFSLEWIYDEETYTETVVTEVIDDISEIYIYESGDGEVIGYYDLYRKTGGVFGYIYDSSFSTVLDEIAGMIDVNVNDGSWIVLDNYETIKLDEEPTAKSKADSDGDGIKDIDELLGTKDADFSKFIKTYLEARGLTLEQYLEAGGETEGKVWTFKSHPKNKDTDGDGLNDKEDGQPKWFNVSDRHLAIFAKLSYNTKDVKDNTSFDNKSLGYASIDELDGWRLVNYTVMENKTGERMMFAANAYQHEVTKEIVVAFRGTDDTLDWIENLLIYPTLWTSHPQAKYAQDYISDIVSDYSSKLYITGHSLGGYLAAYAVGHLGDIDEDAQLEKCVVFNALGMDLSAPRSIKNGLKDNGSKITNYRINDDVVSIIGTHYGTETTLALNYNVAAEYDLDDIDWWECFGSMQINYVMATHDMRNFFTHYELADRY